MSAGILKPMTVVALPKARRRQRRLKKKRDSVNSGPWVWPCFFLSSYVKIEFFLYCFVSLPRSLATCIVMFSGTSIAPVQNAYVRLQLQSEDKVKCISLKW